MKRTALLFTLLFASSAYADLCDYYKSSNSDLYKLVCQNGSTSSKPAGANSTFSSAFNLNSASLPTEPASYGLEVLVHRIRTNATGRALSPTFSIVKGFKKFGTGISTGSNATFYGDDVLQRLIGVPELRTFDAIEGPKGSLPNLNIGTSVALMNFSRGAGLKLGLSGRYNNITDTWGGGPALLATWSRFSIGAGFTREKVSNLLPRLTFTSFQASFRVWILEFEYNRLTDDATPLLTPVDIFTTTVTIKRLILTGAVRRLNYLRSRTTDDAITQNHLAIQFLFSKHFSGGLLYNYIPGATSVGFQYFL